MRLHRGVWAGACLLLALVGCSKDSDEVEGHGVYSPVITGIHSNNEPVARGVPNQLTAQVTNVNNLPLTYHWSAASGTITDTTNATATWTPLDTVATFNVTVSIEARDGDAYFFKTMTVAMSVDNQFIRWTKSDQVQFDPAPAQGGGVLYAGYHNPSTGSSDIYRVDTAMGASTQLTSGYFSATSPSPRADGVDFAFAAKKLSTEASPSIYILPSAGGSPSTERVVAQTNQGQLILASPRFPRMGARVAYNSDSVSTFQSGGITVIHWKNGADLLEGPRTVVNEGQYGFSNGNAFLTNPIWGVDLDSDGNPDSIMSLGVESPGTVSEQVVALYVFPTPAAGPPVSDPSGYREWLSGAQIQSPDWSPNGQYVTFAMKNAGTNERDIWIINRAAANITDAVRVTFGPADESQPRFGPDGNTIFFVSNRVDHYGANGVQGVERRGRNIWSVAGFDKP